MKKKAWAAWTGKRFRELAESKGAAVFVGDDDRINCAVKYRIVCISGHEWSITPNSLHTGKGCPECLRQSTRWTIDRFSRLAAENNGRSLLTGSGFITAHAKQPVECENGHVFMIAPNKMVSGCWCPACSFSGLSRNSLSDSVIMKIDERNSSNRVKERARYRDDIQYKIKKNLRNVTIAAFHRKLANKNKSVMEWIGCTIDELLSHLSSQFEPGMSFENHGRGPGRWQMDHIIPIDDFDLSDDSECRKCFHFTNLQPLWWELNQQKTNKTNWVKPLLAPAS